MYHFLSGFTAKVAGTEKGLGKEPQPTFSTCFGAPFMPRHPSEYGNLLRDLIGLAPGRLLAGQHRLDRRRLRHRLAHADQGDARAARRGARRHRLPMSRCASIRISASACRSRCPVSTRKILNPRDTWADKAAYDAQARKLVAMFRENFKKFEAHVGPDVLQAAPHLAEAAE